MYTNSTTTRDDAVLFDPAKWQTNYSPQNVISIIYQCPEASAIASYRQWQDAGRQVRKGEQAIRILAPIFRKNDDGTEKLSFKSVPVFDISQTDPILDAQCPACKSPVSTLDKFCGECGHGFKPLAIAQPSESYTIATDDETPVIIAEVRHIDATPTTTATATVILGETLAKAVKQITKPLAKAVPAKARKTCPELAYVTVAFTGNGCTVTPTTQHPDTEHIEPIRVPMVSYAGAPIIATLDYDNAAILAGVLDKSDATISTAEIAKTGATIAEYHAQNSGPHLVINQTDSAGCRTRSRIAAKSIA